MDISLLLGAQEFWNALAHDLKNARRKIYLQTMSFEGDKVGKQLADLLTGSAADDKRICIDSYSRFVVNDIFLYPFSLWNNPLRTEVSETRRLIKSLISSGIKVTYTNPLGPLALYYPARNHKKLVVIDDNIVYLGGFNFCEHNFEWFDLMLRIEHPQLGAFLANDFLQTERKINQSVTTRFGTDEVFLLNGLSSEPQFHRIRELLYTAAQSLVVITPYLTFPFLDDIKKIAASGVKTTLIIPGNNNKPLIHHYLSKELCHSAVELRCLPNRMFHLKAILIDRTCLMAGSYNFDFVGRWTQQEVLMTTCDDKVIKRFINDVADPFLTDSIPLDKSRSKPALGLASKALLQIAGVACRVIARIK